MPEAKIEETIGEDRISELPEDLLVLILGLVPTKDAVATMFLSKRWLSIWPMVLTLEYKDSENDDVDDDDDEDEDEDKDEDEDGDKSKKSVWWFLDKSMQLHKAPVIDSLCMKLDRRCPTNVDVGKWVANAIDRCVFQLELKLLWSADPTSLPECLYSCESLVQLTLSHKILVDVPSRACLPSLSLLDLKCVVYKDEDSLVNILSGCPVLKSLFVKRKKNDNVKKFTVKVPPLLELVYTNFWSHNDVEATGRCLVIDTPTLENFNIYDYSRDSWSIENMPFLEYACIKVESYPDKKFLSSLSSVTSLAFLSDAMLVCCSTINFSRLIKLRIHPQESDWLEPLIVLLRNSPKLKDLLVDCKNTPKDLTLPWNQPSYSIPRCLLSQLEVFRWKKYGGREEDEEQFLTHILANSKFLKTATISLKPSLSPEEQHLMMEKLKDISRVSTTSFVQIKTVRLNIEATLDNV